ncbi:MAG: beta galactosidase jelly roll domain-containing protein, partial [Opitutales bacterium]
MKVPGHFEKAGLPGHDGVVWFRKTIELSAEQAKSKAILHLGQIDDMDVTWVNGTRVGGYENPGHHYTVRKYPVPMGLLKTGTNTIAVRVMDHGSPGGIAGKPEQLALQLGKETISLANAWHFSPGANLNALNKQAALVGPKPGWNAEVTAWRAKLDVNDPGMAGKWYASKFDDSKWKTMKLPKHYETAGLPDHDGTVWFRRAIDVHVARGGKPITLQLGAIDDMDMTFFNGHFLGGTETPGFWTKQRVYKVPGEWVKAGRNVITVRVIDHGWSGGMSGPASSMKWVNSENKSNLLSGEWLYHPGVTLKALGLGPLTNPTDQPKIAQPAAPPAVPAPALLRPLTKPSDAVSAFAKGFALKEDATIVIFGGSNAAETQRFGYLETLLAAAHPERRLTLRNMAWPADTVFNQQRPRNFFAANKPGYGEKDRRIKTAVDVVVLWLGQAEALDHSDQVDEFAQAYEETLEQLAPYTGRIVVVTPIPFEDPLGLDLDLKARNATLG